MKIGILGTRGIPNVYGGFEQFAQYLSQGLTRKGHEVYVYSSSSHPYQEPLWNGVHIIHCKDPEDRLGTAGQFMYDLNCNRDAAERKFDVLLHLGYTSDSVWHRRWPRDTVNIINIDGLEWKRAKYNALTRRFLLKAESWAVKWGNVLISDSRGIQDYVTAKYKKQSVYIPYGATIPEQFDPVTLEKWKLKPDGYLLLIARMEPENNIEMIIKGYLASQKHMPLVVVGNTGNGFGQTMIKKYATPGIQFPGAIYDHNAINNLRRYSHLYFHGHSVGGTNPSLLEAMACGCNMAAHNNIFNETILGTDAYYFSDSRDVSNIIDRPQPPSEIEERKVNNVEKIRKLYSWDRIIDDYEQVFIKAVALKK